MITRREILLIRPGTSMKFWLADLKECHSVVAMVSYVNKTDRPKGVRKFTTKTNKRMKTVTVEALKG